MQRILVPTDLSDAMLPAVTFAMRSAQAMHMEVALLHVLDTRQRSHDPLPSIYEATSEVWRQQMKRQCELARHQLDHTRPAPPVAVYTSIGEPLSEILSAIESLEAELVVMCTHTRPTLERLWVGSLTDKLLRSSPRPVVAVRTGRPVGKSVLSHEDESDTALTGGQAPRRLLVPVDLTEGCVPPVIKAGQLADWLGASLTLFYVAEMADDALSLVMGLEGGKPGVRQELRRAAEAQLDKFVNEHAYAFSDTVRNADRMSAVGRIGDEVARVVVEQDMDLVVVGRHGRTGLRGALGTVADRLVRQCPVPVMVVPWATTGH